MSKLIWDCLNRLNYHASQSNNVFSSKGFCKKQKVVKNTVQQLASRSKIEEFTKTTLSGKLFNLEKTLQQVNYSSNFLCSRKNSGEGEFWNDGFYFVTVSERRDWKSVEPYIANQGKAMAILYQLKLLT